MRKNLIAIGNSLGIILEKPILDLLGITKETPLEMRTDGRRLIIEPAEAPRSDRILKATREVISEHEETFRRLAE